MLKNLKQNYLFSNDHSNKSVIEDEPDKPPVLTTAVIVLISFATLVVVAIFSYTFLWKMTESEFDKVNNGMGNETKLNYDKAQEKILSSYEKLENGNYQIPIEKAMELVIKEQH
ncbi:hypothetical protein QEJ31_06850 [Pigmentibacter sp. JX0631]|uniref:hypothetical protein n=1 Tax=Pigmentibacter sp. JX0631 TaxID=2976982 RepID=UPI0024684956|nr:hypothetical protein [Pigmentibacter sp. JX0631]WGL61310.1 hypothetical protein QEJ31_06850 [Pigmentibacter sp. JX0631]